MHRSRIASGLSLVLAALPSVASAAGTITSGNASFTILPQDGVLRPTVFQPLGASGGNYLADAFWAYDPGFSSVSGVSVQSENYAGNTATLTTNNGGTPGTITYTLTATPTLVTLSSTFTFRNTAVNDANARVYHLANVDAGGVTTNTAVLAAPGSITITDGSHPLSFNAAAPTHYIATPFDTIRPKIFGFGVPPLDDSGLPFGPGDFTGAWEWDFALTQNVQYTYSMSYTVAVPEPATAGVLALLPAIVQRRRCR